MKYEILFITVEYIHLNLFKEVNPSVMLGCLLAENLCGYKHTFIYSLD